MNDFRRELVERVFIILDKNNDGVLDASDIKQFYNPKKHPDVMGGRKSEQTVLLEFLETFEQYSSINCQKDGKVSLEEFIDYYSNISASVESDEYF